MSFTLRGTVKQGRVVLVDEVDLEDGSLLEIRVIKSGTQVRMEEEAAHRAKTESTAIRFGWSKAKMSCDPLLVVADLPKSTVPKLKFDGYVTSLPMGGFADDVLIELASFAIELSAPPAELARKIKSALRNRRRGLLLPNSKTARETATSLRELAESQELNDDNEVELWHLAIAAATENNAYIATILQELPIHAAEVEVIKQHHHNKGKTFSATTIRDEQLAHYQDELRGRMFALITSRVRALKRSYSGNNSETKLAKKELGAIAAALQKSISDSGPTGKTGGVLG